MVEAARVAVNHDDRMRIFYERARNSYNHQRKKAKSGTTGRMRFPLLATVSCLIVLVLSVSPTSAQTIMEPNNIRAAYNVNPLLQSGYTGKGVTVAIIGQTIGGTFFSDVNRFSTDLNLPEPSITVVQPYGTTGPSSSQDEITADTEFVHAMAPDAKILLVLVGDHTPLDGFSYVIDQNAADVATMSYYQYYYGNVGLGSASALVQAYDSEYAKSVDEKITLISISGDFGSNNTVPWVPVGQWKGDFWTSHLPDAYLMPQYSQYVTIVGGTALLQQSDGTYSETGWNQSGGGPSNFFPEPSWQVGNGVPQNHRRNIPDIALDASCDTPYSFAYDGKTRFCGTSAAAPTFAGIVADIVQAAGGRIGFINPTLYNIAATDPTTFHDITSGCSLVVVGGTTQNGYCASKGWDAVTGWGSIDAAKLAKHFAPNATIIPEYPLGLPLLAIFMIFAYGLIKRRTRNPRNI
jgi:subtilase family serine protease